VHPLTKFLGGTVRPWAVLLLMAEDSHGRCKTEDDLAVIEHIDDIIGDLDLALAAIE
jgi:hypothetical protein